MTKENEKLRDCLRDAESIITNALRSQPEGDDACKRHLTNAVKEVLGLVYDAKSQMPDGSKYAMEGMGHLSAYDRPSNAAAMRETLAEDRKRLKYERLHECFWDKRAVQCVVRQMLDERDDLSSIDPLSANRMEYFANQLIGAARDGNSVSNSAALREALKCIDSIAKYLEAGTIRDVQHAYRNIQDRVRIALAAPPRNCDVGTADEQESRFEEYCDSNYSQNDVDEECWRCPLLKPMKNCTFSWAQMPYEKARNERESRFDFQSASLI